MKSCPKCNRTFPDEGQKFCTFDGGLLIAPQTFDPNATIRATSIDLNATSDHPEVHKLLALPGIQDCIAQATGKQHCFSISLRGLAWASIGQLSEFLKGMLPMVHWFV